MWEISAEMTYLILVFGLLFLTLGSWPVAAGQLSIMASSLGPKNRAEQAGGFVPE